MLMNMGKRFKELRKERKFTQQQLADRIGLAPSAISSYESGARYPSYDVLIKYSKIFHVTTDYLLGIDELNTVDVSGLNQMEKETVIQVINTFIDAKNNKSASGYRYYLQ